MDNLIQEGVHWYYNVYLKDPGRLIMDEAHTAAPQEWDVVLQVVAKTHSEAKDNIPDEYKNWYVIKIEHPMES